MLKVALKGILGHKARVISTGLAVLLGVGFMAGTLVFTDTIRGAFDDLFADVNAGTDAVVRSNDAIDSDFGVLRGRISDDYVDLLAGIDGVTDIQAEIESFETVIIDSDGDAVGAGGAPQFGRVWSGTGPLSPWVLQDGDREPVADDEIVMDVFTADVSGYEVGDTVPIVTPQAGLQQYELVNRVKFGTADGTLGATQVLFTLDEAQRALGEAGAVDAIGLAANGISQEELASRVEAVLADAGVTDTEVLTGAEITEETQNDIAENLDPFRTVLVSFGIVAVIVGAFIIYNTFSILVAQRTQEMALLRAVGATRRQVLQSVLVEAAVVGLLASIIGLFVGIGLAAGIKSLFSAVGFDVPTSGFELSTTTIVVSLSIGIGVTLLSALLPARRASLVPPIAALRDVAIDRSGSSRIRVVASIAALALGGVGLAIGLTGGGVQLVIFSALLLLVGVGTAGPVLAPPVARVLGYPIEALRGVTGRMAKENALRNPKRTSSTALALTIGVSLVVFISIFVQSFKDSTKAIFEEQFTGDLVIDSGSFGFTGFDPDLRDQVAADPTVDQVTGIRIAPVRVGTAEQFAATAADPDADDGVEERFLQAVDADAASRMFDIGGDQALLADLGTDGLAISQSKADDTGWTIGTPIRVDFISGTELDLTVEAIYTEEELAEAMFVDTTAFDAAGLADNFDIQLFVTLEDGVSFDEGEVAVEAIVSPGYPAAEVQNLAAYVDGQLGFIDVILGLIYALLGFSCLLAGFGIANTLQLSIVERRREIGLSRAVGMTRAQVRSSFRWESVIVALFGTVMGVGLGAVFGVSAVLALADDSFTLSIPGTTLIIIGVVGSIFGYLVALRPAWRASKLDVLQAIATE